MGTGQRTAPAGSGRSHTFKAPPPVRIVLEHPLQLKDTFALEAEKGASPATKRLTVDKDHDVVEFERVDDKAIYKLVHLRAERERDVIDSKLNGSLLTQRGKAKWTTPGLPSRTPTESKKPATPSLWRDPPHTKDRLLRDEDEWISADVRVEEPKTGGKK